MESTVDSMARVFGQTRFTTTDHDMQNSNQGPPVYSLIKASSVGSLCFESAIWVMAIIQGNI